MVLMSVSSTTPKYRVAIEFKNQATVGEDNLCLITTKWTKTRLYFKYFFPLLLVVLSLGVVVLKDEA